MSKERGRSRQRTWLAHDRPESAIPIRKVALKPGDIFGELTVVKFLRRSYRKRSHLYLLLCNCGQYAIRSTGELRTAVKQGHVPCCLTCQAELRRGVAINRRNWLHQYSLLRWEDSGRLYSEEWEERFREAFAEDLRQHGYDLPVSPRLEKPLVAADNGGLPAFAGVEVVEREEDREYEELIRAGQPDLDRSEEARSWPETKTKPVVYAEPWARERPYATLHAWAADKNRWEIERPRIAMARSIEKAKREQKEAASKPKSHVRCPAVGATIPVMICDVRVHTNELICARQVEGRMHGFGPARDLIVEVMKGTKVSMVLCGEGIGTNWAARLYSPRGMRRFAVVWTKDVPPKPGTRICASTKAERKRSKSSKRRKPPVNLPPP